MSTAKVNVKIHNDLGYSMGKFWLAHRAGNSGKPEGVFGTDLDAGQDSPTYQFTLESLTTDEWTLMWSSSQGNLIGTARFFSGEVDIGSGNVTLLATATGSVVQVVQGSKTAGTSGIVQYGYAA